MNDFEGGKFDFKLGLPGAMHGRGEDMSYQMTKLEYPISCDLQRSFTAGFAGDENLHKRLPFQSPTDRKSNNSPTISQSSNLSSSQLQSLLNYDNWKKLNLSNCGNLDPQLLSLYQNAQGFELPGLARRKNASRETTCMLKAWLNEHRKNPYPTKGEKVMLAIITKMTLTQVSTWFANARRRLKKENKMTWTPKNRTSDDMDDLDDEEMDEEALGNDTNDDDFADLDDMGIGGNHMPSPLHQTSSSESSNMHKRRRESSEILPSNERKGKIWSLIDGDQASSKLGHSLDNSDLSPSSSCSLGQIRPPSQTSMDQADKDAAFYIKQTFMTLSKEARKFETSRGAISSMSGLALAAASLAEGISRDNSRHLEIAKIPPPCLMQTGSAERSTELRGSLWQELPIQRF